MQPFLDDEDAVPVTGESRAKFLTMTEGTDTAYQLAKQYGMHVAWGTDILFDPGLTHKQGKILAKMIRWFTPAEVLTMVTATNAELLRMSGPRNPYPGKLGVVEEGALADLLLVDGDPVADITLLSRPESSLVIIMKDGVAVKNTLPVARVA
jgi:imidazolonepropionase-like amidohydrolase